MGKGKGGESKTTVELPKEITAQAKENLQLAKAIAMLPQVQNFGVTQAAFTPQQEAAFKGTQNAAGAFGMPVASGTGMPQAETVNGIRGYSTKPYYDQMMGQVDPNVRAQYANFLANPFGAAGGQQSSGGGKGAGGRSTASNDRVAAAENNLRSFGSGK